MVCEPSISASTGGPPTNIHTASDVLHTNCHHVITAPDWFRFGVNDMIQMSPSAGLAGGLVLADRVTFGTPTSAGVIADHTAAPLTPFNHWPLTTVGIVGRASTATMPSSM